MDHSRKFPAKHQFFRALPVSTGVSRVAALCLEVANYTWVPFSEALASMHAAALSMLGPVQMEDLWLKPTYVQRVNAAAQNPGLVHWCSLQLLKRSETGPCRPGPTRLLIQLTHWWGFLPWWLWDQLSCFSASWSVTPQFQRSESASHCLGVMTHHRGCHGKERPTWR